MLRVATWNPELTRKGPGLLLQSIRDRDDPQIAAVVAVLDRLEADVVVLTGIDYDYDQLALSALQAKLRAAGADYPHALALRPNTGIPTGLDLDGNGKLGEARDAQGFGRFAGSAGMAILSRFPLGEPRDFSAFLWRDLPDANLPPDMSAEARDIQRLSTSGHYEVPVTYAEGKTLRLLVWYATPPVFDGPEDRNGRRNHDEAAFWTHLLNGTLPFPAPEKPYVLLGQSNLDPVDGDGIHAAMQGLLTHPALQDPVPLGEAMHDDPGQKGDPLADTAQYGGTVGALRVDVLLPGADLEVKAAGVMWPDDDDPFATTHLAASRHYPVWAEIALPRR